jgi:hypothetical protein
VKKLGVVITDGVGFRNFILSDFIKEAKSSFDKVIIFSCLPESSYESYNLDCDIIELEVFKEKFQTWFFRKAKEVSHLQLHAKNNFGIQDNLRMAKSKANNPQGIATRLLHRFSKKNNSEKWILRYNKWQQLTFKKNATTIKYTDVLKEYDIDLLFFTHQRPPYIAPFVYAAESLRIKTATFIFSWDNLASKGRMAGNFDYYLVWSDLMKKELLHFYQSIKSNQIEVVGTPQFEPYILDRYNMSKESFFQRFNLNPNLPTLLFSCGDVSTSKNDPLYIETIVKAIVNNQLIKKVNLLVRTSPAEEPTRFEFLSTKYPLISWNYPLWKLARSNHQESWSQRIPSVEDVIDLKAILQYADVSINMLSTMSLDSMLFDKPVINAVFGNNDNGLYNDQRFLNYAHIENVIESNAVAIAKNEAELISAINQCIQTPNYKLKEQKELLNLQIGKPLNGTSKRISETLRNLLN